MTAKDAIAAMLASALREAPVVVEQAVIRAVHGPGQVSAGAVDITIVGGEESGAEKSCTSWTSNFDYAVASIGRTALAGRRAVVLVVGGKYLPDSVISGGG